MKKLKKILAGISLLFLLAFSVLPARADTIGATQTGPTGTVGASGDIGPVGTVGPTSPTGPTDQAGTQSSVNETNVATGANSTNQNATTSNSATNVSDTSQNNINNNTGANATSGSNNISDNSSVGAVSTGNVDGTVNVINLGNVSPASGSSISAQKINNTIPGDVLISAGLANNQSSFPLSASTNQNNSITGSSSANLNSLGNNNVVAVVKKGDTNISNGIIVNADSGSNNLDSNTTIASFSSGDVNLGVNLLNLTGLSSPEKLDINLYSLDALNGDLIIPDLTNVSTGSSSLNSNIVNTANNTTLMENLNNNINNGVSVNPNTGANTVEKNSSVGSVKTGDSQTSSAVENINDVPIFYIINVFGHWFGSAVGDIGNFVVNQFGGSSSNATNDPANNSSDPTATSQANNTTGSNSTNNNQISNNNSSSTLLNENNNINNNILINANTGKNKVTNNTKVGDISTGSIKVFTNVINVFDNLTQTFKKVKIGIINIFGDWHGNLRSQPAADSNATALNSMINPTVNNQNSSSNFSAETVNNSLANNAQDISSSKQNIISGQKQILRNQVLAAQTNTTPNDSGKANSSQQQNTTTAAKKGFQFPLFLSLPTGFIGLWGLYEIVLRFAIAKRK